MKKIIKYLSVGYIISLINIMHLGYFNVLLDATEKTNIIFLTTITIIVILLNIMSNIVTGWLICENNFFNEEKNK